MSNIVVDGFGTYGVGPADRSGRIKRSLSEIDRVQREGGTVRVVLPNLESGHATVGEIDQRGAAEIVAWLCDRIVAALLERERRGERLSGFERELLRIWCETVPQMYHVAAASGGPIFLLPLNVSGRPTSDPPEEIVLAAHPAEYNVGWQVTEALQSIPELSCPACRDAGSGWSKSHIDTLHFPPDAGLLYAWTRFVRLNDEKWEERSTNQAQQAH